VPVDEQTITLDGTGPVYYRAAPAAGAPPLYLHGIPTSSDDWTPFLERAGGIAPDLIGFGRSSKAANLDYRLQGLADFAGRLLGELGVERCSLVGHDWGSAVAVVAAQRHPDLVERVVLLDPVPLLHGFAWRGAARMLRAPAIGELLIGSVSRRMLARALRRASGAPASWTQARLAEVWEQFDQGTQRAILRLYRSTAPDALEDALGALQDIPTLLVWGVEDPRFSDELATRCAARLRPGAVERVQAGRWPWLADPSVVERVAAFLSP
jgi:pimeloyl-ACP methyl ester carboxylesterase